MSDISIHTPSQQMVTCYLQDRHIKDPIRLIREDAASYRCSVSEIHMQNHRLFERHSVILSAQDCEALPEKLKAEGWYNFFRANALFFVENEFPKAFPEAEKKGKKRNIPEALVILRDLSDRLQFPPAQNALSLCYLWGLGVNQDFALMTTWLKKAADQNFVIAVRNMGWCYREGQGVTKHYQSAFEYYERALKLGLVSAAFDIGSLFENAKPPNLQEALRYYQHAAKHGVEKAQSKVDELRDKLPVMKPQVTQPAQRLEQSMINFQEFFNLTPRVQSLEKQVQQLSQQLAQKDLQIAEMQKQMREQAELHHKEVKEMLSTLLQKLDAKESLEEKPAS